MNSEELFFEYKGLAHLIAEFYAKKLKFFDLQKDIHQEAMLGLWKACLNCKNVSSFKGYARWKIKGAIIDMIINSMPGKKSLNKIKLISIEGIDPNSLEKSNLEILITNERDNKTRKALKETKFSTREKQVVICILAGMTKSQTATKIGVAPSKIYHSSERIIEKVRKQAA